MEKGQQKRILLSKQHFLESVLNNAGPFPFWDLTFHGANGSTQEQMPVCARDGIQLPDSKDAPQDLYTHGYYSKSPLPIETANTEWEHVTALPERDGKWDQGLVFHLLACLHRWAFSGIQSNTVRKTQTCIKGSALPHQALSCLRGVSGVALLDTAGKTHLVPQNRECLKAGNVFVCHLVSELWATPWAQEEITLWFTRN